MKPLKLQHTEYSRYGDRRTVRYDPTTKTCTVTGKSNYYRCGWKPGNQTTLDFFDFEGGPFLSVNGYFVLMEGFVGEVDALHIGKTRKGYAKVLVHLKDGLVPMPKKRKSRKGSA